MEETKENVAKILSDLYSEYEMAKDDDGRAAVALRIMVALEEHGLNKPDPITEEPVKPSPDYRRLCFGPTKEELQSEKLKAKFIPPSEDYQKLIKELTEDFKRLTQPPLGLGNGFRKRFLKETYYEKPIFPEIWKMVYNKKISMHAGLTTKNIMCSVEELREPAGHELERFDCPDRLPLRIRLFESVGYDRSFTKEMFTNAATLESNGWTEVTSLRTDWNGLAGIAKFFTATHLAHMEDLRPKEKPKPIEEKVDELFATY